MSGYQSYGSHNRAMNGSYPIHSPKPSGPTSFKPDSHKSVDTESQYTNPYVEQHHRQQMGLGDPRNNKNDKLSIHRPRINRKNTGDEKAKSSLTTNFDPMKDRHLWAMWRTAVNGRIVDQVRKNEQFKQESLMGPEDFSSIVTDDDPRNPTPYGKDLASVPPLSRFIRLNQQSKNIAQDLMNEGQGKLETTQFIYYGLPRVTVNNNNNNGNNSNNNINNNMGRINMNGSHLNGNYGNNDNNINPADLGATLPPDYNDSPPLHSGLQSNLY